MNDASVHLQRICRTSLHACVAAALMLSAATLGGCAANSAGPSNAMAMAPASDGATIAFDQIDGPPPQVFDRMVNVLDSESKLRSLAVVSREGPAAYRVRSYLSAQVVSGKTVIAWVWDVYDRNQERALRLSGTEQIAGKASRDAWSAADDLVLRKIAQSGFSGLSAMLNGTVPADGATQPAPAPSASGPAVATATPAPTDTGNNSVVALGYTDR
jgi:hypothetical protein